WRGSEPFGQGTRPDPSPIGERVASVHTALKVGDKAGLDDLIDSANAALSILYGVAGRYGDALAVAERRLARAQTRPGQELGDAAADPDTASDWQAWYLVASGDPAAARAIAAPKALEGRSFGPQHAMVLVEALAALEDWKALDEIMPHARAATAGNALLEPFCDRALGLMTAGAGDRRSARKHLVRALSGFEKFKLPYQATRTRQIMASLTMARGVRRVSDTDLQD